MVTAGASTSWLEQAARAFEPDGPASPLEMATSVDPLYRTRPHLQYVSDRITTAVRDVETGHNRRLIIQMPPRSGKTTLTTQYTPLWLLRRHPDWHLALISHDPTLAASWGRQIRRWVEAGAAGPKVRIARDAGAVSEWETTNGGGVLSRSTRGSLTGRGARVMLIDDPTKDFVDAHSDAERDRVWNWWLSVAQTRLEPPHLVIVVATRWHEDDIIGRLQSAETEGNPDDWEVIRLPALADETSDVLGRGPGEPLWSPLPALADETIDDAIARWEEVRSSVGSYTFAALYQQRPAPARGAIFNSDWWRFWTTNPDRVTEDGRVVYLEPETDLAGARWLDSWDMSFKGSDDSDFVVGQRWAKKDPYRYLIAQQRGRWSFTQSLERLRAWGDGKGPHGHLVHERLVEDKANGTAVIDFLKREITGLIPINPTNSKVGRARAVTPEAEAGNVYLPHPDDPGNDWVRDVIDELRMFPNGSHDDTVDSLTQALSRLRDAGHGQVTVPGAGGQVQVRRDYAAAARTTPRRTTTTSSRGGGGLRRVRIPGR